MTVLASYVTGTWITPRDDGRPLFDAVTGEEVARVLALDRWPVAPEPLDPPHEYATTRMSSTSTPATRARRRQ